MGNGENLYDGCQFAVDHQKRETTKHEFARAVRVARPALRSLGDQLDGVGNLLGEARGDAFVARQVPFDSGEEFACGLLVELNVFSGHAGVQR